MESQGVAPNRVTYNSLIHACRAPESETEEKALKISSEERIKRVLSLLDRMKEKKLKPDSTTLNSIVRVFVPGLGHASMTRKPEDHHESDHHDSRGQGPQQKREKEEGGGKEAKPKEGEGDEQRSGKSMLSQQIDQAMELIDQKLVPQFPKVAPDAQLFNMLIRACVRRGLAERATALHQRMRAANVPPTLETIRTLLYNLESGPQVPSSLPLHDAPERRADSPTHTERVRGSRVCSEATERGHRKPASGYNCLREGGGHCGAIWRLGKGAGARAGDEGKQGQAECQGFQLPPT